MRDLLNNCTSVNLMCVNSGYDLTDEVSLTTTATGIDLRGEGRKCLVVINVGRTATVTAIVSITSGTDNTTFGTTEVTRVLNDVGILEVDLVPQNRYIRAELTLSSTAATGLHNYITVAITGIVYNERYIRSNVA